MVRPNLENLRLLVTLRELQKAEIELRVSKSSNNLRRLDHHRAECVDLIDGQVEAWAASISGSSVGLDFARAWSNAIRDGEAALGRIDLQIEEAAVAHTALSAGLAVAGAHAEAAAQLRDRAVRRERRRREEQAMADFGDRHLYRRLRS